MKPKFIEVIGEFTPRGGISIFLTLVTQRPESLQRPKKIKVENYSVNILLD